MKPLLKYTKIVLFAACLVSGKAQGGGIPTIDVLLNMLAEQEVALSQEELILVGEQLLEIRKQLTELQQTKAALTGNRGFGNILNTVIEQGARRYLPADYSQIDTAMSGLISAAVATINTLPADFLPAGPMRDSFNAMVKQLARDTVIGQAAYSQTHKNISTIEGLVSAIDSSTDLKGATEVQSRLIAENVFAQNEANRISSLHYIRETNRAVKEQQSAARAATFFSRPLPPY